MTRRTGTPDPPARSVVAGRSGTTSTPATVVVGLQDRHLYCFEGTEFFDFQRTRNFLTNPAQYAPNLRSSELAVVRRAADAIEPLAGITLTNTSDTEATYENPAQGIRHRIHFRHSRNELKQRLEQADVGVIYQGHARYGRGPCFGPNGSPRNGNTGDHWGAGDDATGTGIFRMGHEWIAVPDTEVIEHGYRTGLKTLAEAYVGTRHPHAGPGAREIESREADPDLRGHFRQLRRNESSRTPKTVEQLDPGLARFVSGVVPNAPIHSFRAAEEGHQHDHVLVDAGAAHLRNTTVRCRFFAHMGCSTLPHNAEVFRRIVGAPAGDTKHAVWTTNLSRIWGYWLFLYHYLTYPNPAQGVPWLPQVQHATTQASAALLSTRQGWQLRMA